jgi:hypothetical protein
LPRVPARAVLRAARSVLSPEFVRPLPRAEVRSVVLVGMLSSMHREQDGCAPCERLVSRPSVESTAASAQEKR